tara:strand:- start:180 stop:455 length:276 start_codon:yes stop_codon:yes gene_type:complete
VSDLSEIVYEREHHGARDQMRVKVGSQTEEEEEEENASEFINCNSITTCSSCEESYFYYHCQEEEENKEKRFHDGERDGIQSGGTNDGTAG